MDIYGFINSPDVAAYCRETNKVWTPFEMALIIGRSRSCTLADKHAAWRELMHDYPDMPTPKNIHHESFESFHEKLKTIIDYEERVLAIFKRPEHGAVYRHSARWHGKYEYSDSVFTTFEKAWANALECWESDEAPLIIIDKMFVDDKDRIEVYFDYDGNPKYQPSIIGAYQARADWFPDIDFNELDDRMFEDLFYVDIPLPFKLGDILTVPATYPGEKNSVFVIKPFTEADYQLQAKCLSREMGDGSDMIYWGYFVTNEGVVYGDHTDVFDKFEYYQGELTGKDRVLHYLSLYLKGELDLPELMTMQCRIMQECQLENNLDFRNHGRYIPDELLVENRPTKEEK